MNAVGVLQSIHVRYWRLKVSMRKVALCLSKRLKCLERRLERWAQMCEGRRQKARSPSQSELRTVRADADISDYHLNFRRDRSIVNFLSQKRLRTGWHIIPRELSDLARRHTECDHTLLLYYDYEILSCHDPPINMCAL